MLGLKVVLGTCVLANSLLLTVTAHASTYYVATNGNDSNAGTETAPWRSIANAVNRMRAGDTTYVRGGVYKEGFIVFRRSGTASAPIKLLSALDESPVIESDTIGEKSIQIVNAAGVNKPIGWITIEGFEIRNFRAAILMRSAHDIIIRRNWIHNIAAPPGKVTGDVHAQGISGTGLRILIDRNRIERVGSFEACAVNPGHCNQDHGMYIAGSEWVITNNLVYNNLAFGIQLAAKYPYDPAQHAGQEYAGGKNWLIANNTFAYQNYRGAITVWGPGKDTRIENNIFYENCVKCPTGYSNVQGINMSSKSSGIVIRNNLAYSSSSKPLLDSTRAIEGVSYKQSSNIVNTDTPGFVNAPSTLPASPNFALTERSPAINAGLSLTEITRTSFDGTPRPQGRAYDIGAYEYKTDGDTRSPEVVTELQIR